MIESGNKSTFDKLPNYEPKIKYNDLAPVNVKALTYHKELPTVEQPPIMKDETIPNLTMATINGKEGLNSDDLERIRKEIHKTPYISYIPDDVWQRMNKIRVARVDGQVAGLMALVDLGNNWVEIGPLLIMPEYNQLTRMIIAQKLFIFTREGIKNQNAFWTSHNPRILEMADNVPGFTKISLLKSLTILPILKRHLRIAWANISPESRKAKAAMEVEFGPKPKDTIKAGDVFAIKLAKLNP